jgi:hypothetical protein
MLYSGLKRKNCAFTRRASPAVPISCWSLWYAGVLFHGGQGLFDHSPIVLDLVPAAFVAFAFAYRRFSGAMLAVAVLSSLVNLYGLATWKKMPRPARATLAWAPLWPRTQAASLFNATVSLVGQPPRQPAHRIRPHVAFGVEFGEYLRRALGVSVEHGDGDPPQGKQPRWRRFRAKQPL